MIYFFSGLTKCLGSGWWDGSNVWRALIRPPFNVIDPEILMRWKCLFPSRGVFICLLEIGYPVLYLERQDAKDLADRHLCNARRNRVHDGNVSLRLIMIVLNLAAFGPGLVRFQRQSISLRPQEVVHESRALCTPSPRVFLDSHDSLFAVDDGEPYC